MKERIFYIDFLRVISCILVVLTHCHFDNECSDNISRLFVLSLMFICMPSSELFISLSGAALLPISKNMNSFYITRFKKLIPPFIFWSIIISLTIGYLTGESLPQIFSKISLIPFKPVTYAYWFIYVIIGLYLVAPIISPWLKYASRKQIEFVLSIWFVSLLLPFISKYTNINFDSNGNYNYLLYYFSGYIGYWIIGYYLRVYPIKFFEGRFFTCIILCLTYLAFLMFNINQIDANFVGNLQFGAAIIVVLLYTLIQNINKKNTLIFNFISRLASCSYFIYLTHILIISLLKKYFLDSIELFVPLKIILLAISTLFICFSSCLLIRKLPYSKFITG